MPEKRSGEFLRGLAWNIPASIGAPADLAETVLNLGLAGGGYLGHKLGLLGADQLPQLLEGSPGTTKWWAKGTPMEESADPAFVRGQLTGGLAAAAYGMLPQMRMRQGQLNSIIVPQVWQEKYGLPKVGPDGRPLGRLDMEGDKTHLALPRQKSAQDTFSFPTTVQTAHLLKQLSPETLGTPIGDSYVTLSPGGGKLASPTTLGHADITNNEIVIRTVDPRTGRPYSPQELLNVLHHEATHFADMKGGSLGSGSWPGRINPQDPMFVSGLARLRDRYPDLEVEMARILGRDAHTRYMDDAGEIRARVAGGSSPIIAPGDATLRQLLRQESQGRIPSIVATDGIRSFALPASAFGPTGSLELRSTSPTRTEVWHKDGSILGLVKHDHAVGAKAPGGRKP